MAAFSILDLSNLSDKIKMEYFVFFYHLFAHKNYEFTVFYYTTKFIFRNHPKGDYGIKTRVIFGVIFVYPPRTQRPTRTFRKTLE